MVMMVIRMMILIHDYDSTTSMVIVFISMPPTCMTSQFAGNHTTYYQGKKQNCQNSSKLFHVSYFLYKDRWIDSPDNYIIYGKSYMIHRFKSVVKQRETDCLRDCYFKVWLLKSKIMGGRYCFTFLFLKFSNYKTFS